jgi:hypothetical protein
MSLAMLCDASCEANMAPDHGDADLVLIGEACTAPWPRFSRI